MAYYIINRNKWQELKRMFDCAMMIISYCEILAEVNSNDYKEKEQK